jgi:hypothetical protein
LVFGSRLSDDGKGTGDNLCAGIRRRGTAFLLNILHCSIVCTELYVHASSSHEIKNERKFQAKNRFLIVHCGKVVFRFAKALGASLPAGKINYKLHRDFGLRIVYVTTSQLHYDHNNIVASLFHPKEKETT